MDRQGLHRALRAALILLALAACGLAGATSPRAPAARPALPPVDGEVIVRWRADAQTTLRHALAARAAPADVRIVLARRAQALGQRVGQVLEAGQPIADDAQVVRAAGVAAEALAERLRRDPDVLSAEPNHRRRIASVPNDPLYAAAAPGLRPRGPDAGQWYLRRPSEFVSAIDAEPAWRLTRGEPGVVVAVLDTGVRPEHPDLAGRLLPGHDFVTDPRVANDGDGRDTDPRDPGDWTSAAENADPSGPFFGCDPQGIGAREEMPSSWHGTATTSLVGAATGFSTAGAGMAGLAPQAGLLPVRVLGKCFGSDADIQAGMRWAAGLPVPGVPINPHPARVLNLSLGGGGACGGYQRVVDELRARGTVVVVAAGNSTGGPVAAPGNCRGVITVLALRHVGTKVGFSDLGPEITVSAPGGNCVNIEPGTPCLYPILAASDRGLRGPLEPAWSDSYDITVGTSFASPLVAGTAALMLALRPALDPATVEAALRRSARPFPTSGADNGDDPTPVAACRAPDGGEQLQCYCNTAVCGAGMLDAGAAVALARTIDPVVEPPPPQPVSSRGGGAASAGWLLALAGVAVWLRRRRGLSGEDARG